MSDDLKVTNSVRIPRREIDATFSPSGGPGGQHANRSSTRVELRLDVVNTSAFTDEQRRRVIGRLGAEVRVVADDSRSQHRNRAIAEQRLVDRVAGALVVRPSRRSTRPTRGSQRRRLDAKKRRGELKRQRRRPPADRDG